MWPGVRYLPPLVSPHWLNTGPGWTLAARRREEARRGGEWSESNFSSLILQTTFSKYWLKLYPADFCPNKQSFNLDLFKPRDYLKPFATLQFHLKSIYKVWVWVWFIKRIIRLLQLLAVWAEQLPEWRDWKLFSVLPGVWCLVLTPNHFVITILQSHLPRAVAVEM